MSPAPSGKKETTMALIHSADRVSTRAHVAPSRRNAHPSIYLLCGFGFIVAAALSIHVLFDVVF